MKSVLLQSYLACAALALGEAAALCAGGFASAWPLGLLLLVLVTLFGYGCAGRFWPLLAILLLGFTLAGVRSPALSADRTRFWKVRERPAEVVSLFPRVHEDLSRRLGLGLPRRSTALALNRAMLLGERKGIPLSVRRDFISAGTLHIFAISGLHVMLVAHVLLILLRVMLLPYRVACVVAIPCLWLYLGLIGFPPSAVRAALMASFCLAAPVCFRRPDPLMAWSLTFLIVHLIQPHLLLNVGNLLSFTVMLAILGSLELVRVTRLESWSFLFVSLAAWLAGVPIAAAAFGRFTPGGLLANFALIPAAYYAVITSLLGLLASYVWTPLAAHFNNLSALFTEALVGLSALVARLPGTNFEIVRWTIPQCVACYGAFGLAAWLFVSVRRHRLF